MTPAETLRRAADVLERLSAEATPGPWEAVTHYHRETRKPVLFEVPGVADLEGNGAGGLGKEEDAAWIATMSPAVAAPLVAWLRMVAEHRDLVLDENAAYALDFARAVLTAAGEET